MSNNVYFLKLYRWGYDSTVTVRVKAENLPEAKNIARKRYAGDIFCIVEQFLEFYF